MSTEHQYDYDWIVIGSGFGGSVSALRLAEKGYKVLVLECGKRFSDDDFPKNTWDAKRYFFRPELGLRGILRLTVFKDIFIASGSGVGGGSLGYANTLYRAPQRFYDDAQWAALGNWGDDLRPHYDEAERMLGVVSVEKDDPADLLLKEFGEETGCGDTYSKTRVGVFLGGEPGVTVPDPFFGGEGPDRTGCIECGRCMVGCPHGAKNTLVKNYLWFAEKLGVRIEDSRMVTDVRPLGASDGSKGYVVSDMRSGAWLTRRQPRELRTRGVVFSAGALGTNGLLANIKHNGSLKISDRLGELVRTNSEAILGITLPEDYPDDITKRVAITSSVYPDADTHIETCVYGDAGGSMQYLNTILTGDGTRVTRPLKWLATAVRHPRKFWKATFFKGGSKRAIILLVMQTLDNAIALRATPKRFGKGVKLQTEQDPLKPNPTFIPVGNEVAEWFEKRTGGIAQSSTMEALFNIPSTAHILGGAVIGADETSGVIDPHHCIFGYENLLVCDGSAVPANVGVNPSLTITAMSELAMSHVPAKGMQAFPARDAAPVMTAPALQPPAAESAEPAAAG